MVKRKVKKIPFISSITQDFLALGQIMTRERIKAIRVSFQLSQSKFADLMGIKLGTLKSWEGGYKRPSSPASALLYLAETRPEGFIKNRQKILEHWAIFSKRLEIKSMDSLKDSSDQEDQSAFL